MKETIVYGKTVALALKRGAEELGVDESKAEYEVLEEPKKGFSASARRTPSCVCIISRPRRKSLLIL